MKIVVSEVALADLDRLQAFLADKNDKAAKRAKGKLIDAIDSLSTFPERGRPLADGSFRELMVPFGKSSYVIRYVYRAALETVTITRVWHGLERRH